MYLELNTASGFSFLAGASQPEDLVAEAARLGYEALALCVAAGVFGEGDRWTPPEPMFRNFGPATYYFRVCDLSGSRPEQVGVYRYTRVYPASWMGETPPAETPPGETPCCTTYRTAR